MMDISDQNM